MRRKSFFQSQHSANPNHDSCRNKSSSNIRHERRERQIPQQHRRSLTDRVNADKKANSKVAIEQPLCAVIAICCLCAGTALHRIKENEQLGKQQTRKYGMKRVILPQVRKFCRIAHNPHPYFSEQRDLAVKMRRLFQHRPLRPHGKSNVAAADRQEPHFRF